METLLHDIRYGLRMLVRKPGFTVVAVVTLALGIGVNTAMFSVVHAVILQPLPFASGERLAVVKIEDSRGNAERELVSFPNFLDWRNRTQAFEDMVAYAAAARLVYESGVPEIVPGLRVSGRFFSLLRVAPSMGSINLPDEREAAPARVVLVSHSFWRYRLQSDPGAVGRTLRLGDQNYQIVGVLPSDLRLVLPGADPQTELFTPLEARLEERTDRRSRWLHVLGRLKTGSQLEQAQAEMDVIGAQVRRENTREAEKFRIRVLATKEEVIGPVTSPLLLLWGAVGLVLLIACSNLANLVLARTIVRSRELAIRSVVGARRFGLFRLVLMEVLLLSMVGGVVGLLLGWWLKDLYVGLAPARMPRVQDVSLDLSVLAFALGAALLSGVASGWVPAYRASRMSPSEAIRRTGGPSGDIRGLFRRLLVAGEVALSIVLLAGAGLLLHSLFRLLNVHPGFEVENRLTIHTLHLGRLSGPEQADFYAQVLGRVQALPGIESAGVVSVLPLSDLSTHASFRTSALLEGSPPPGLKESIPLEQIAVSSGYFSAMGIPLRTGRTFGDWDAAAARPMVVVSRSLADLLWPGRDPIGQTLIRGRYEVAGVAADVRPHSMNVAPPNILYYPHQQRGGFAGMTLVVHTEGAAGDVYPSVRTQILALSRNVLFLSVSPMEDRYYGSMVRPRFYAVLLASFAILAVVLASFGLYGVISYSVSRRTQEMGIRMALGARRADILRLVMGQGSGLITMGLAAGLAAALALTRYMETMLFEVRPFDPPTFVAATGLLCAVALFASYLPARRAARVEPLEALRYE